MIPEVYREALTKKIWLNYLDKKSVNRVLLRVYNEVLDSNQFPKNCEIFTIRVDPKSPKLLLHSTGLSFKFLLYYKRAIGNMNSLSFSFNFRFSPCFYLNTVHYAKEDSQDSFDTF